MPAEASASPLAPALQALRQRRPLAARSALDQLPPAQRTLPGARLIEGLVHTRLGRIDDALQSLRPLLAAGAPWADEATAAMADALALDRRHEALQALLQERPAWAASPRGQLFRARLQADGDPEAAAAALQSLCDDGATVAPLARLAGFDAVRLLDRLGRYAEAFALATRLHAAQPPFPIDDYLADLQRQQRLLQTKGAAWCPPRAAPVDGVAFVVGLPRSGTTLLTQMLDAHPQVSGIGEHEGISTVANGLVSAGAWPLRLKQLNPETAATLQRGYVDSARQAAGADARWTVDKSLVTWRWLPAVATVLPGAALLRIVRDPRDLAISALLSDLDPSDFGWTGQLAMSRRVIAAERTLVPLALQTLGLPHRMLKLESLVADPHTVMGDVLGTLQLPPDERVLHPERHTRTAVTLSHAQVRQPINDRSIGRWKNYEFAFEGDWEI